jgi:membrane associated rhomboid family serine protease
MGLRLFTPHQPPEIRRFIHSLFFPLLLATVMFVLKLVESLETISFVKWGIHPRDTACWWTIFTAPLVHGDWGHLWSNLTSFLVLSVSLLNFYRGISYRVFWLLYIFSGAILWLIGRDSWHIGMSGVVYGLATFLFFSGTIRRHIPLMAISLMVVFLYGSMIWGIFPLTAKLPYSWEAHFSGTIVGIVLAIIYRHKGPQKPHKVWDEESEDPNEEAYWLVDGKS